MRAEERLLLKRSPRRQESFENIDFENIDSMVLNDFGPRATPRGVVYGAFRRPRGVS